VETCDPLLKKLGLGVRRGGYIVGYSFCIEDHPASGFYVPLRHAGGDNVEDPAQGLRYLRDQAAGFTGDLCGANLSYDLDFLAEAQVTFPQVHRFRDCQVAEPLLDELQDHYSLDAIAKRRGVPGKDETLLREAALAYHLDAKQDLWQFPARYVGPYAEQDVRLPLLLLRRQEREIEEQDLEKVYDLECRLLPVLVRMRRRGIRVDFKRLGEIEDWSVQEEQRCLDEVYTATLVRISVGDVWKPNILAKAFKAAGIELQSTAKGQPQIDKNLFATCKHPVAKLVERARKVNKLRTTFAASIREHAIGDRIHCSFSQLRKTDDTTDEDNGARYGRVSCTDPNLQQQPSRDDFAQMWRSIYVPDGDGLWASSDYSQQEPRWLVHFAELAKCIGAEVAAEKYRTDPTTDNHTMMSRLIYGYKDTEEPSKKHRNYAKTIFLGLCYGMGGAKLARKLDLSTKWIRNRQDRQIEVAGDEAQSILDQFNARVPFVKKLAKLCETRAKKRGYIVTVLGRRCRFPKARKGDGTYEWTHKACNRLIQGSSGDQTKVAMVEGDAAGYELQLQVHDELGLTVASKHEADGLAEIMRTCVPARVPFRVDVEIGPSWGEAK
jgi:DNA polymerase I-like protein with 3'-5' exonuclease and polymerase domains